MEILESPSFSMGAVVYKPKKGSPSRKQVLPLSRSKTNLVAEPPAPSVVAGSTAIAAATLAASAGATFHFDSPPVSDDESTPSVDLDGQAPLLILPPKVWDTIGSYLPFREVARCAGACKDWKNAVAKFVRHVNVQLMDGVRIKALRAITPNLECIALRDAVSLLQMLGDGEVLKVLTKMVELKCTPRTTLWSGGRAISSADAMLEFSLVAPHLPTTLVKLEVPSSRFSRGSLGYLERLKSLTHLDLSRGDWRADDWQWAPLNDDPVRDDWVDHFPTGLVVLNLSYCHVLSDRILKRFKRFPKLRILDVEGCFQLTDVGVSSLGPNIEVLNMAQCIGVFRKGEARLGVLPVQLEKLRMSFNFNDHFVNYIPHSLHSLFLEKSYVTDAGLKYILSVLPNLAELSVAACINVGDATLEVLPAKLKFLDLWHNRNVTDTGLLAMKRLTALEVLDVTSCSKLTCQGIVDAAQPALRLISVGALFFPDHLLKCVGIMRDATGVFRSRPRLFSETVKV